MQRSDNSLQVTSKSIEAVIALARPIAVTVSARIQAQSKITAGHQLFHRPAPRMPRLSAALQQDDRRRVGVSADAGRKRETVRPGEAAGLDEDCVTHQCPASPE